MAPTIIDDDDSRKWQPYKSKHPVLNIICVVAMTPVHGWRNARVLVLEKHALITAYVYS